MGTRPRKSPAEPMSVRQWRLSVALLVVRDALVTVACALTALAHLEPPAGPNLAALCVLVAALIWGRRIYQTRQQKGEL